MTVRNPHRRFDERLAPHTWGETASMAAEALWSQMHRLTRTPYRLRWAARHACNRLRKERDQARAEAFDLAIKVVSMEGSAAKFKATLKSLETLDDTTLARVVRRVIREWRELS